MAHVVSPPAEMARSGDSADAGEAPRPSAPMARKKEVTGALSDFMAGLSGKHGVREGSLLPPERIPAPKRATDRRRTRPQRKKGRPRAAPSPRPNQGSGTSASVSFAASAVTIS